MNDVDLAALGGVIALGDVLEFCGDPQCLGGVVPELGGPGDAHAAFADAQVQQLVDIRLVFQ